MDTKVTRVEANSALNAIEYLVLKNVRTSFVVEDFANALEKEMRLLVEFIEDELVINWNYYGALAYALIEYEEDKKHEAGKQQYPGFTEVQIFALRFLNLCS